MRFSLYTWNSCRVCTTARRVQSSPANSPNMQYIPPVQPEVMRSDHVGLWLGDRSPPDGSYCIENFRTIALSWCTRFAMKIWLNNIPHSSRNKTNNRFVYLYTSRRRWDNWILTSMWLVKNWRNQQMWSFPYRLYAMKIIYSLLNELIISKNCMYICTFDEGRWKEGSYDDLYSS